MEEGQILEGSPFSVMAEGDEFMSEMTSTMTFAERGFLDRAEEDHDTSLDYEDNLGSNGDDKTGLDDKNGSVGLEAGGQMTGSDENDLGRDDVWKKHQRAIMETKEKRERLMKRLKRQRQLAEQHLQEERDKEQFERMEREMEKEICELNDKRLVGSRNTRVPGRKKGVTKGSWVTKVNNVAEMDALSKNKKPPDSHNK